jgi:hypothetical protein
MPDMSQGIVESAPVEMRVAIENETMESKLSKPNPGPFTFAVRRFLPFKPCHSSLAAQALIFKP